MNPLTMLRLLSSFCLLFFSWVSATQAGTSYYQIDLIIFTHAYTEKDQQETPIQASISYDVASAIPLQPRASSGNGAYHLMATSSSSLQYAWSRLNQHSQYHPIVHYTWIQPANSQRPVHLSVGASNGWSVDGTIRVRQSHYYLLDTALQFKTPNSQHWNFTFTQKQRLKPGNIYYLDHPQAGMLINVHRVR